MGRTHREAMLDKGVETKYSIQAPTYTCSTCPAEIGRGGEYFSAIVFEEESFLRREICPECWKRGTIDAEAAYAYWKARRPDPPEKPARRRFDIELLREFFLKLEKDLEEEDPGEEEPGPPAVLRAPREGAPGGGPDLASSSAEEGEALQAGGREGEKEREESADQRGLEEARPRAPLGREEKVRLCFLLALLLLRSKRLVLRGAERRDGAELLRLYEKAEPGSEHLVEDPRLTREDLERVKESLGELLQMEL